MTKILENPEFKSEAEEAAWWDSHPDETLAVFEEAAKDGTLGRGTLARRSQTAATSFVSTRRISNSQKSSLSNAACAIRPT